MPLSVSDRSTYSALDAIMTHSSSKNTSWPDSLVEQGPGYVMRLLSFCRSIFHASVFFVKSTHRPIQTEDAVDYNSGGWAESSRTYVCGTDI